ncbi:MAG: sensor histidine kinase [Pseudobdellovibrionaceae bacterium]
MKLFGAYFPWRFFLSLYFTQLSALISLIVLTTVMVSYVLNFPFFTITTLYYSGIAFVLSSLFSALIAYRYAIPMRRLILKAMKTANKKQLEGIEVDEEDWLEDEPGEFSEISRAIDKVRRKLKKRRIQLAHEREESQALMSGLQDAVVSVSRDERIKFYNSRFATFFLTRDLMKQIQANQPVLLTEVFREPEVLMAFRKVLSDAQSAQATVKIVNRLDGAVRTYSLLVSPLREERSRELYALHALFHDITDIHRAEQIRIEFVENASHELRTPLTSIKGYVATLKEDLQVGKYDQALTFLEIVNKSVDRLVDLVNDMLTLSSLESEYRIKKDHVDPVMITNEVVERLSNLANAKKIRIRIQVDASSFLADSVKVIQALQNLVSNSIKYIQEGGEIQILWSENQGNIRLKVIDNGPGISAEHLDRLFERFYRIDKGRAREVGGTGLGLAIVKHIMQAHGGSVEVSSDPGQGCEFTCIFPRKI